MRPAPRVPPPTPSETPRDRRNFALGVGNGILYQAGDGFVDANTVVPVFLSRLTSSNALIGFASSMSDLGWLLPQVLVAPWAARFARQVPIYTLAATVRACGLALVALLAWPLRDHPAALLAAFFVGYGAYAFAAGLGAVAFMEVVGRTVPHARLAAFWAQRMFWGGLLAAMASLLVRQALAMPDTGIAYALLFGAATVTVSIGYAMFARIEEPAHEPPPRTSPLALLRQGFVLFRGHGPFRHLVLSRSVLNVWFAASPFIVLFTVKDLGGGGRSVGTFLFARTAGFVLSNLAWNAIVKRRGTRALMQIGSALCGVLALAAAAVAIASPWRLGWIGATAAIVLLEAIVFGGGVAQSALNVGYGSLMIQLAPVRSRQSFVPLLNTFIGPTMLLPVLGGVLVDRVNAPALFAVCGVAALIGTRSAFLLPRIGGEALAEPIQPEQPS